MKGFVFKGNLGDLADQVSTWSKKKSRKKKQKQNSFFNFCWKSKFGFEIYFLIWLWKGKPKEIQN